MHGVLGLVPVQAGFRPKVTEPTGGTVEQCMCPQEKRLATGWSFRRAQWSPADKPIMIRVHNGCDRPLYGMGAPVTTQMGRQP